MNKPRPPAPLRGGRPGPGWRAAWAAAGLGLATVAPLPSEPPPAPSAAPAAEFLERHRPALEGLVGGLDLARPELAAVRAAAEAGDWDGAARAILAHFSGKLWSDPLPPATPEVLAAADLALRDEFFQQGLLYRQPRTPAGGIDWADRGPRHDKEWAWLFHRHRFLVDLAGAWSATGDERYAAAADRLWRDWLDSNPYPNRLTFSASWRALEAARRMLEAWPQAFGALRGSASFRPETRLLVLRSLLDHADTLRHHPSFWGGNHLLTETAALAQLAVAWPEFRDAPVWLETALQRTRREVLAQTYPDGAYLELTNHYQRIVLLNLQRVLDLADRLPDRELPADLRERAEAMWDYYTAVQRPDGFGPLNSASDLEYNRADALRAAARHHRPDWLWICTNGQSGQPPAEGPSRWFPWAGQAVLRDDWSAGSGWVFFDAGPYGTAHQHRDTLHFSLWAAGKEFLADGGRYLYQPGPWKEYFRGPWSHNVVLLDDAPSVPPPAAARGQPGPMVWQPTASGTLVSGTVRWPADPASGRAGGRHTRTLLHRPSRWWLVIDRGWALGPHRWTTLWNFAAERRVVRHGPGLRTADPAGAQLDLTPLLDPPDEMVEWRGRESSSPRGWQSLEYNEKSPASQWECRQRSVGPWWQAWLLTVGEPGRPAPEVRVAPAGATGLTVDFRDGGGAGRWRIEISPDGTARAVGEPAP